MKINKENIDYIATQLINELTVELYEFTNDVPNDDHVRIAVLGEIRGILKTAEALKEMMKS